MNEKERIAKLEIDLRAIKSKMLFEETKREMAQMRKEWYENVIYPYCCERLKELNKKAK